MLKSYRIRDCVSLPTLRGLFIVVMYEMSLVLIIVANFKISVSPAKRKSRAFEEMKKKD